MATMKTPVRTLPNVCAPHDQRAHPSPTLLHPPFAPLNFCVKLCIKLIEKRPVCVYIIYQ